MDIWDGYTSTWYIRKRGNVPCPFLITKYCGPSPFFILKPIQAVVNLNGPVLIFKHIFIAPYPYVVL